MGKSTHFFGQPVYGQLIKSLDREKIIELSRKNDGEKYIKSFTGFTHLLTMLYAVIMRFDSLLFAEGNKVHRWNYTTSQLLTAADVFQTVGTADAVITGFEMSVDHKKTYVAFYEPKQSGKNGSLWVIDTDKGTILEKYDNVFYRPVKMIYKKK